MTDPDRNTVIDTGGGGGGVATVAVVVILILALLVFLFLVLGGGGLFGPADDSPDVEINPDINVPPEDGNGGEVPPGQEPAPEPGAPGA